MRRIHSSLWKDNFREIRHSLARFLSIVAIITLGVSFFVGIKQAGPSMKLTAANYFEAFDMPDGRIYSTLGLEQSDIDLLASIEDIDVLPMQTLLVREEDQQHNIQLMEYDSESAYLFYDVVEGRLPEAEDEIVLDEMLQYNDETDSNQGYQLGDRIQLTTNITNDDSDSEDAITIETSEFTVVGFARSPIFYDRTQRPFVGAHAFAVVLDDVIQGEIYTQAFYWDRAIKDNRSFTEDYESASKQRAEQVKDIFSDQPDIRLANIKAEAQKEIDDARKEIEDGYEQLEEGENALNQAADDLKAGWEGYQTGLDEYQSGLEAYESGRLELDQQRETLNAARAQLDDGFNQIIVNRNRLEAGFAEYYDRLNQFQNVTADQRQQMLEGQAAIDAGKQQVEDALKELDQAQDQLNQEAARLQSVQDFIGRFDGGMDAETIQTLQENGTLAHLQALLPDQFGDPLNLQLGALKAQLAGLQLAIDKISQQESELADNQELINQAQAAVIESFSPIYQEYYPQGSYDSYQDFVTQLKQALEADISRLQALVENPEKRQAEIDKVSNQLKQVTADIEQLEAELTQVQEQLNDLGQPEERVTQLQVEIANQQLEMDRLNQQLVSLQNQEQTDEVQAEIARLQGMLSQTQVRLDELNQQLATEETNLQVYQDLLARQAEGMRNLESLKAEQAQLEAQLDQLQFQPELTQAAIIERLNQAIQHLNQLEAANNPIIQAENALNDHQAQLDEARQKLTVTQEELADAQAQLDEGQAQIAEAQGLLDNAYNTLIGTSNQLAVAETALNNGEYEWQNGQALFNDAQRQLDDAQRQLAEAEEELESGRQELDDGQAEFDEQAAKFEEEKETALQDLAEAEEKLAQAEKNLAELEAPTYEFLNRTDNYAYQSLNNNADQLNVISNIFPVFFLLIAILVTFTTIKRMVSEQRNYVGTLMQLGYPRHLILSKFVTYAFISASLGTILGWIVGHLVFPPIIMAAYNILYYFDTPTITVSWFWNILVGIIALMTALIPAVVQPYQLLKLQPAQLLRPEPPRAGGKIVLEHWNWFWEKLPFKVKMTVRNLFRYKGRNAMTLFGVAGCTMLMVTGYGVSDTLNHLIDQESQYIQVYNSIVLLNSDNEEDAQTLIDEIEQMENVEATYPVSQEIVEVRAEDGQILSVNLAVPLGSADTFNQFIRLKERGSSQLIDLQDEGPIINERLTELIDDSQQEQLTVRDEDLHQFTVPVNGVYESYVQHNIYMTPDQYQEYIGDDLQPTVLYINYHNPDDYEAIDKQIGEMSGVVTVLNLEDSIQSTSDALSSLDLITIVLIVSAAALAFVVLYNLTNINIGERLRELSTIKVLGFYDHEVSLYVYGEILVLTILGGFVGMGLGYLLNYWLMKTMQMVDILFYPVVQPLSFFYSFILTIIFSAIVMIVMHFKLKQVDMVESLKAIE